MALGAVPLLRFLAFHRIAGREERGCGDGSTEGESSEAASSEPSESSEKEIDITNKTPFIRAIRMNCADFLAEKCQKICRIENFN